jgi:hypothetical protein
MEVMASENQPPLFICKSFHELATIERNFYIKIIYPSGHSAHFFLKFFIFGCMFIVQTSNKSSAKKSWQKAFRRKKRNDYYKRYGNGLGLRSSHRQQFPVRDE